MTDQKAEIEMLKQLLWQAENAARREWVGLTEEEIFEVIRPLCHSDFVADMLVETSMNEYRAIEAKLKEKNA